MLCKKHVVLITLAAMAAAGAILAQTATSEPQERAYRLEGSWIAKVPGTPIQWSYVMSPLDPSGRRATLSASLHVRIPAELWFPDLVPNVDYFSPFAGEAVMTGPDTASFTAVAYGIKKVVPSESYPFWEQVVLICVSSGELKFTAPGKIQATHHIADYLPAADVDGDGLPDPGQAPFLCLPAATTLDTRVGLVPPCTP